MSVRLKTFLVGKKIPTLFFLIYDVILKKKFFILIFVVHVLFPCLLKRIRLEQDFNFFVLNFISTFLYYTDLEVHLMPFNQVLAQLVFQPSFFQTLKYCYQNHVFVQQLFLSDVYHAVLLFVCKVVLDVCLEVNKLVLHVYISQRKFYRLVESPTSILYCHFLLFTFLVYKLM